MTAGEIIKKLRIENNYTQQELAEMLGLKLSTMQKYESGAIQNLKLETIREICQIFGISPAILIYPENIIFPNDGRYKLTELYNGAEMAHLLNVFLKLNRKGREKVIAYMLDLEELAKYENETVKGNTYNP